MKRFWLPTSSHAWRPEGRRYMGQVANFASRLRRDTSRLGLAVVLFAGVCLAAPPPQTATSAAQQNAALKAQMDQFGQMLADALVKMFDSRPIFILERPKGAYLDGFGVIVHTELNLYPMAPLSPFNSQAALDVEIKKEAEQKPLRLKQLQDRLRELLLEQSAAMSLLPRDQNLAIVIHLYNARSDPRIPSQIVVQARRQALLDLQADGRKPAPAALARAINLREF